MPEVFYGKESFNGFFFENIFESDSKFKDVRVR